VEVDNNCRETSAVRTYDVRGASNRGCNPKRACGLAKDMAVAFNVEALRLDAERDTEA
jgi:hypothetical protein